MVIARNRPLLALAVLFLLHAAGAIAVDPNFRIYLDEYPLAPLERVVFAYDAGPTPISTLTTPPATTARDLENQLAWDFSGLSGEGVVIQVAPVTDPWSCYVPDPVRNGCGFALPNNDILLVRDNLVSGSRGATALDFDGTATLLERAQVISEGVNAETRLCFNPAYYPDVPFLVFQGSDGRGRFLSAADSPWQSAVFSCDSDLNTATNGARCNQTTGTGGGFRAGDGLPGQALARVVRAGTLTLPSGHAVDSILVEALAAFDVYGLGCFIDGGDISLWQLFWYVPHYGAIAQMVSQQDTASLDAWTTAESTSIGFGLLPPLTIQADAVTGTSITVSWDPGRVTGFIDEFVVHWGTQPGGTAPPSDSSELRGDTIPVAQTNYTITGLAPGTTYYVSVTTKRAYTDPLAAVTTVYRSIELPQSMGADIDGDGTRDTSYPPEVPATTSLVSDELIVNRQVDILPPPPSPTVASQFACLGLCVDERFPGQLPMTLPGEAAVRGREMLWMYVHTDATIMMAVTKAGTSLVLAP